MDILEKIKLELIDTLHSNFGLVKDIFTEDLTFLETKKSVYDYDRLKNEFSDMSNLYDSFDDDEDDNDRGMFGGTTPSYLEKKINSLRNPDKYYLNQMVLKDFNKISQGPVSNPDKELIKKLISRIHLLYIKDNNGNITELLIRNFPITTIPKSIFSLHSLKKLCINKCLYVKEIPNEIFHLQNLEFLNFSGNSLTKIPDSLGYISNLKILVLKSNYIKFIPDSFGKLSKLTTLDLSYNKLERLPINLKNLKSLWEAYESIINIKKDKNVAVRSQKYEEAGILRDKEKKMLDSGACGASFSENPLSEPPIEIIHQGTQALHAYWNSLKEGGYSLNELKIVIVGEGGCGKTSLLKGLTQEGFDINESQTHGINIRTHAMQNRKKSNIKTHLWDFGGQQIMHSTHQFFLSKRSLYIIVIDSRRDEKVEYWLKHVEIFGGKSPVIIVINKIDENPGFDLNRKFLSEKYGNIVGFFRVSCLKNEGLNELKNGIIESFDRIEHINSIWPSSWFEIKDAIENTTDYYITTEEYDKICSNSNLTIEQKDVLIEYLNDLGVILYFKDLPLRDVNVINPHWVTEAVYAIINSGELAKNKGILDVNILDKILKLDLYPSTKHSFFISLMKKFELCYELNSDHFLIPDLLSVEEPVYNFDYVDSINIIYKYSFLPKSIIARLIVRLHKDIKDNHRWRTGIVLQNHKFNSQAIIKSDDEEKTIRIIVSGVGKREYYAIIRHTLLDIHTSFEFINYDERILLEDGSTCSFEHLLFLESKNVEFYIPEGSKTSYQVKKLLGSVLQSESDKNEEVLTLLQELVTKYDNDRLTILEEANRIIDLKPNIAGIGINLNALLDSIIKKKK